MEWKKNGRVGYNHIYFYVLIAKKKIAYPLLLKCSIILAIESIGTAKLNPSAASTFMILTPTTSPSTLMSGPPEFPYAIKVEYIYLNIATGKTHMQKQINEQNMFVLLEHEHVYPFINEGIISSIGGVKKLCFWGELERKNYHIDCTICL